MRICLAAPVLIVAASPALGAPQQGASAPLSDGALIYGAGYEEAYRAGFEQGYERGLDDGGDDVRPEDDRAAQDPAVRTTVTTAGHGAGETRFRQVPRGGREERSAPVLPRQLPRRATTRRR